MAGSGVPRKASMHTQDSATDSPFMAKVMMPMDWVVDSVATAPSVSMVSTLHSAATDSAAMASVATRSSAATASAATALVPTPTSVDLEVVTALASQLSPVAAEARVPWVVQV